MYATILLVETTTTEATETTTTTIPTTIPTTPTTTTATSKLPVKEPTDILFSTVAHYFEEQGVTKDEVQQRFIYLLHFIVLA